MPRGRRLDAQDCVQHVMLRGVEQRDIFQDDRDRSDFVERLGRILPEAGTRCFAWALMPNHVHLVLQTGPVPLARVMARLGTGYAQAFNRRHDRVGHLFQNRYKSILVDEESHLLTLVGYVHRNPLRAGLVPSLDALARHPWTGHATLLGHCGAPFQDARAVLDRFGVNVPAARRRLVAWMGGDAGCAEDRAPEPGESREPARAAPSEGPSAAARELEALISRVCATRGVFERDLRSAGRAHAIARARAEVAYRACVELAVPGAVVARALGVSEAAVSRARERGRAICGAAADAPPLGKKVNYARNVPFRGD